MPFLAALPALAAAGTGIAGLAGATVPAALAIGAPALSGAVGLAKGIAEEDPLQALIGAAGGAGGALGAAANAPLGAAKSLAEGGAQAAQAATDVAQTGGALAEAPQLIESATELAPAVGSIPVDLSQRVSEAIATDIPGEALPKALQAAPKAPSNALANASKVAAGATSAAQAAGALIGALRGGPGGVGGISGLNTTASLAPVGGARLGGLPSAPDVNVPLVPTDIQVEVPRNLGVLDLLRAFRG